MNDSQVNSSVPAFQQSLPMLLHRTLASVMPPFREIFADHDLTDQQWRVLRALWEADRLSFADLARITVLPAPSLVGILDRLEARGLVARTRSDRDRRSVTVAATGSGRALYAAVEPRIQAIHAELRARASEQDWAMLEAILMKIAAKDPAQARTDAA
jgi:homoprotocatechuate degradation regulator HpaR